MKASSQNIKRLLSAMLVFVVCVASWLTISPAFYYITRGAKSFPKKWRLFLLLISPLFLIGYCALLCLLYVFIDLGYRRYRFTNNEAIERITEVSFPEVKIKDSSMGLPSFTGDYSDDFILQMKSKPSNEVILKLDSLCAHTKEWSKRENRYNYSRMWGNGLDAPKGEDDDEDVHFSIDYYVGGDTLVLSCGSW